MAKSDKDTQKESDNRKSDIGRTVLKTFDKSREVMPEMESSVEMALHTLPHEIEDMTIGPAPTLPENAGNMRPLDKMTYLQEMDGSWQLTDAFCSVLGVATHLVKAGQPHTDALVDSNIRTSSGSPQRSLLWATALAIIFLNTKCAINRDEWDMLAQKANKWLAKFVRDVPLLLKKASEFLVQYKVI